MTFAVKREIDGLIYIREDDYIIADGWDKAEMILISGIASGRFDSSCVLYGEVVQVIEIETIEFLKCIVQLFGQKSREN